MPTTATLERHPCFQASARHTYARIHLPVAPACNVQCRFCDRKYSCVNESRPGVTARVMTPAQALEHLKTSLDRVPNISVVGIAGPGDPFANPDETLETFHLVKKAFPELMLCVSSNGLNVLPFVNDLQTLGVSHVTITVNAADPAVGAEVYDWVRGPSETLRGEEAAGLLWENQVTAIRALVFRGIVVKVNTVYIPGVNSFHIEQISGAVSRLGASLHNVIPLIPTANTAFAHLKEPSPEEMSAVRAKAQKYLPQMEHCSRCRADAVGLLGQKNEGEETRPVEFAARVQTPPLAQAFSAGSFTDPGRPYLAACSRDGTEVDLHLGETTQIRVYSMTDGEPRQIDVRTAPDAQSGSQRWARLAGLLGDCSILAAGGVGPIPRSVLTASGLRVRIFEGPIAQAFTLDETTAAVPEKPFVCGATCGGDTQGCNGQG